MLSPHLPSQPLPTRNGPESTPPERVRVIAAQQTETAGKEQISGRALDRLEQLITVPLYAFLTVRLWPSDLGLESAYPILLLASEGLALVFLLIRRSTDRVTANLWAWGVAAGGSATALLVRPGGEPLHLFAAFSFAVTGCLLQIAAKLALRRSFGLVAANRGVKTRGVYRWVRHPMYAGYMLTHLGFLTFAPSAWNLAVYVVTWTLLVLRISAEEAVLERDPRYREFRQSVRYRLLPGLY